MYQEKIFKVIAIVVLAVMVLTVATPAFAGNTCGGRSCDDVPGHECEHGRHTGNPHCDDQPNPNPGPGPNPNPVPGGDGGSGSNDGGNGNTDSETIYNDCLWRSSIVVVSENIMYLITMTENVATSVYSSTLPYAGEAYQITISPSGCYVAYSEQVNDSKQYDLFTQSVYGETAKQLTNTNGNESWPEWDYNNLLHYTSDSNSIQATDLYGSFTRSEVVGGSDAVSSPDGKQFAFSFGEGNISRYNLYTHQTTKTGVIGHALSWHLNDALAFSRSTSIYTLEGDVETEAVKKASILLYSPDGRYAVTVTGGKLSIAQVYSDGSIGTIEPLITGTSLDSTDLSKVRPDWWMPTK